MSNGATTETPGPESIDEAARAIVHDCRRAVRRLDTLIGERNDLLLMQARRSIRRAAARAAELGSSQAHAA
jgi:hypothetical protein